ncbi:MAG TPA: hypothetical protein VLF61_02795 [Rhabdochlamydiaceae bacterium]|nr:hypothetical protein [Rhabdochlamydiaceae bacterium]
MNAIDLTTNTIIATIPVGANDLYIATNSTVTFVYVSNNTGGTVSVIDLSTNTVVATVTVGTRPAQLSVAPPFVPPTPTPPPSPSSFGPRGSQFTNRFLTQTDFINTITWHAPNNFTPVFYHIFRDAALTDLAGTVSASGELEFADHNRRPKQFYTYFIIAVDQSGATLNIGNVTVVPIS